MANEEVVSAPQVRVFHNGKQVGYATNFQGTIAINNVPVDVLGDEFTQEYAVASVKCAASFGSFFLYEKSLSAVGIIPNTIETGVPVSFPEAQLDLYHWIEKTVLYRLIGSKSARINFGVATGGVMANNVSFDVRKIDTNPQ